MASQFNKVPASSTLQLTPFQSKIPDSQVEELKTLVKFGKLAPRTYESSHDNRLWGITSDWIAAAKEQWLNEFDWRKHEDHINSFPQFKTPIKDDDGKSYDIHFAALFSKKADAVPIFFFHGWPGSFLEFLPMMAEAAKKYTPDTLPFHIIAPSLIGYTFSASPPLDKDWKDEDTARLMDKLAKGLGFGSGYIAQGGDIGSRISRVLAIHHDSCKAVHLNFCLIPPPGGTDKYAVNEIEEKTLKKVSAFRSRGLAYAIEHGTRTSTIGHVLASNPIALLAWIGEKFLEWSDEDPSIDTILESITLWWFTETFPRAIYSYRERFENCETLTATEPPKLAKPNSGPGDAANPDNFIKIPFGYSWCPEDMGSVPRSWIETTGDVVFFKQHDKGGHFAAMEVPELILGDIEEFVKQVWPTASKL
ncbi:MAG: hypothetical protein M4579_003337 [Chaenotheca gracillima]|nr:MAG: hypothetical protein M4579_003337 [Chaenotheca gracillima]